jgi:hypothetical protein
MGYEGVEFAGYHNRSAEELRRLCDANGLKIVGTHIGLNTLQGEELEKTVAFNKVMGNRYLIVPGLPEERRSSRAAWLETAHIFDGIATKLAPHGMRTGYHNHHIEFAAMDGELPWDTFFGNTRKEVVMQLDTGNMYHGGAEPVGLLSGLPPDLHGRQGDVLEDSHVRVEIELLKDHPDLGTELGDVGRRVAQGHTVHDDLALLDQLQLVDAADQGALAGSAGPADHQNLAGAHTQIHIIQDVERAEPLVDTAKADHG